MLRRVTLRLPSLSGSDGIPYRSVAEWLESIRMKRYILHFRSAGLDTMECVLELTAECGHWGRGGLGTGWHSWGMGHQAQCLTSLS